MLKLTVFLSEVLKQRQACDNPHVRSFLDASPMAPSLPRAVQSPPVTAVGVRIEAPKEVKEDRTLSPPVTVAPAPIVVSPPRSDATSKAATSSSSSEDLSPQGEWTPPPTPKANSPPSSIESSPQDKNKDSKPSRASTPTLPDTTSEVSQEEPQGGAVEGSQEGYAQSHINLEDYYDAGPTNTFPVRSLTYMEDGVKIPAGLAVGRLLHAVSLVPLMGSSVMIFYFSFHHPR